MEDEADYEIFDVGIMIYLKGRQDPVTVLSGMRAPTDRSQYNGEYIVEATESFIEDQQRDQCVPWIRIASSNGTVTLFSKEEVQLIRILQPEVEVNNDE